MGITLEMCSSLGTDESESELEMPLGDFLVEEFDCESEEGEPLDAVESVRELRERRR